MDGNEPEPVTNADTVGYVGSDENGKLTLILNKDNLKGTFINLPRFTADGYRITYTVKELLIGSELAENSDYIIHYTPEEQAKDEQPGYIISNIRSTNLTGTKIWQDDSNADGRRPETVERCVCAGVRTAMHIRASPPVTTTMRARPMPPGSTWGRS